MKKKLSKKDLAFFKQVRDEQRKVKAEIQELSARSKRTTISKAELMQKIAEARKRNTLIQLNHPDNFAFAIQDIIGSISASKKSVKAGKRSGQKRLKSSVRWRDKYLLFRAQYLKVNKKLNQTISEQKIINVFIQRNKKAPKSKSVYSKYRK